MLPMAHEDRLNKMTTLKQAWSSCSACPLSQTRTNVVFDNGNPSARIFVIGDAPRPKSDITGLPFAGEEGERFNSLLKVVGISRSDVWISNVCLCRPISPRKDKDNRPPSVKEIRSCSPRLIEEINIVRPEILVLAGNTPLNVATGKRGIMKNRGLQDSSWSGDGFTINKIFATLHPASLLYGSIEQIKLKAECMFSDWKQIGGMLSGKTKGENA